jgi:enoyl-CoA hydratase
LIDLRVEGAIATFTLRNPARRNAMTRAMWQALSALVQFVQKQSVRCIVIQGEAGHFCAGGDISEYHEFRFQPDSLRRFHEHDVAPALHALLACDVPIVAQIEGNCMGGGLEIAACCDIRVAGRSASFGAPIAKLGMPMAPRELDIVLRVAGEATVREMLLEARIFSAQHMLERGFVQRMVDDCAVAAEVLATAQRVAALSPQAARLNKQAMREFYQEKTAPSQLNMRLSAIENAANDAAHTDPYAYAASAEHIEGVSAFLDKRSPKF